MLKAIALDNEPTRLNAIKTFSATAKNIHLQKTFSQHEEVFAHLRKFPVDLIFVNVSLTSIPASDFINALQQDVMVLFIVHQESGISVESGRTFDYLPHSFTEQEFATTINKITEKYKMRKSFDDEAAQLYIRADYRLITIMQNEILYIEGLDDYLKIHLADKKPVVARMTMKVILDKLNPAKFVRIHRSFIIPISKIDAVKSRVVNLGGQSLPVGSTYEEDFLRHYSKNSGINQ